MKLGALYLDECCLLPRVWRAENAWERARGLLGRPPLKSGEGFWIEPCASVHTVGMRYNLDLAFINSKGIAIKQVLNLKPLRMASQIGARATLETLAGELSASALQTGTRVEWREIVTPSPERVA